MGRAIACPTFSYIALDPLLFWFYFGKFISGSAPDLMDNIILFFWQIHILHKHML